MSDPILSIITPIYNCEKYLSKSLDSILEQTFKDYEIILVDDSSTDDTYKIASEYIEKIDNEAELIWCNINKGCGCRRNDGINLSKGKYIGIHDGDDISCVDRFEKQINYLEENKDIFCVGGHAFKIDSYSKIIGEMIYPPQNNDEIINMIKNKCMNPIIDSTTVFRKKDYLELGGYSDDDHIKLVPDLQLWCTAILRNKKFHNLQEHLIKYRVNPEGNTLKHKSEMIKQHMIVWKRFMGRR